MTETGYNTTTLSEFVAACLGRGIPLGRPLPIVLVVGRRGTGKSALLGRLGESLSESRPHARLDLGGLAADPDPVAILAGLTSQLHRGTRYVGAIAFPRLGLGLLALDLNPDDSLRERRGQLDGSLSNPGAAPQLTAMVQRVLGDLTGSWKPDQQAGALVAEWATGSLVSLVRRRKADGMKQWYAARGTAVGGADQDTLYRLCEWRAGTGAAWRAERTLCAAFLADLRAHFNQPRPRRPWRLPTKCLVLLDNTGGAGGTRFLETLAECRAEMPPHDADPLVVVAGHDARAEGDLGSGPLADARVRVGDLADATIYGPNYDNWQVQAKDSPDLPLWYRVRLADLDTHGLQRIVTTRELDGIRGHDADFIHDLTGGHLGTAATLAAALKDGRARHVDLFSGHDQLLRTLFPDDTGDAMLRAMAVCAATPGASLAACSAVFRFLQLTEVTAEDVHDRVTASMWAARNGGDLDLHPLLRRLLLRRLADDPALWRQVHEGYQAYFAANHDETRVWHHKLAGEQPGQAAGLGKLIQRMDALVDEVSPAQWCSELDSITTAPNTLRPPEVPWETVASLAGPASGDGVDRQRTIARIIVAQWLHGDRLFDPRHSLARLLNTEYWNLANCMKANGAVFGHKAADFGTIAKNWGWTQ